MKKSFHRHAFLSIVPIFDRSHLFNLFLLLLGAFLIGWLFPLIVRFFRGRNRAEQKMVFPETSFSGMIDEPASYTKPEEIEKVPADLSDKKRVPFHYVDDQNIKKLLAVFRKEPPQVIALVLAYLGDDLVRQVYAELPVDLQVRVAAEAGAVRQTSADQVRMIDQDIRKKMDYILGGITVLIRLLEEVDYKVRYNILEYLMNDKPQIYEKVRQSLVLFEDLMHFPDAAIQTILRELKTHSLARALKNANPDLIVKFLSNLSAGGATLLKEEIERVGDLNDEQIEMERQRILDKIKALEKEGRIHFRDQKKISVFDSEDATAPLLPSLPEEELVQARISPSDVEASLKMGQDLMAQEKYADAIPYFLSVTLSNPNDAAVYRQLGNCYYYCGRLEESVQQFEKAIALDPSDSALIEWVQQFKQNRVS